MSTLRVRMTLSDLTSSPEGHKLSARAPGPFVSMDPEIGSSPNYRGRHPRRDESGAAIRTFTPNPDDVQHPNDPLLYLPKGDPRLNDAKYPTTLKRLPDGQIDPSQPGLRELRGTMDLTVNGAVNLAELGIASGSEIWVTIEAVNPVAVVDPNRPAPTTADERRIADERRAADDRRAGRP